MRCRLSHTNNTIILAQTKDTFAPHDTFIRRHIGPYNEPDTQKMLKVIGGCPALLYNSKLRAHSFLRPITGEESMASLINKTVPASIRLKDPMPLPDGKGEAEQLALFKEMMDKNDVFR